MGNGNLYEWIFKRKSIRKYYQEPLNETVLGEISDYLKTVQPIIPDIKTEITVWNDEVKNMLPIKAPQYLLVFSETKPGYLVNVGFLLQQVDLYLSSRGIGSCYLGMAHPTKEAKNSSNLEFTMILAFGNATEPVHRNNISEFKRNPMEKTTESVGLENIFEAVRIAPSASNGQPWFFVQEEGIIHAFCDKHNPVKALMYDKMNKIDMGIAFCHLKIAAEHFGNKVEFIFDDPTHVNTPKGYSYVASVKLTKND